MARFTNGHRDALAATDRLHEDVTAEYGDVLYIKAYDRVLEAQLKQPDPKWHGEPVTVAETRRGSSAG